MKNAIFDTNSIYYLESQLSLEEFNIIKSKVDKKELSIFVTPISIIEMVSRIVEKPEDFGWVKDSVKKLLELNPNFLPTPEDQLTEYVSNTPTDPMEIIAWKEIFISLSLAPNFDKLKNGFAVPSEGRIRSVDAQKIYEFRKNYESQYILDVETPLKLYINKFKEKVAKRTHTRLNKEKIPDFKRYINSIEWINIIKLMIINRTLRPLPEDEKEVQIVLKKVTFIKKSYEDFFLHIFQQGYRPNIKKKNDYNDWHFNFYFTDFNDYVFITSEENVVFEELKRRGRCIKISGLV